MKAAAHLAAKQSFLSVHFISVTLNTP